MTSKSACEATIKDKRRDNAKSDNKHASKSAISSDKKVDTLKNNGETVLI